MWFMFRDGVHVQNLLIKADSSVEIRNLQDNQVYQGVWFCVNLNSIEIDDSKDYRWVFYSAEDADK